MDNKTREETALPPRNQGALGLRVCAQPQLAHQGAEWPLALPPKCSFPRGTFITCDIKSSQATQANLPVCTELYVRLWSLGTCNPLS